MTSTTTSSTSPGTRSSTGPLDPVGADLSHVLRALKLSGIKHTLPERLALARQHQLGHAAFLQLLLADEVARRFTEAAAGVLILGPVGAGKTHLATALGHAAIRRRMSVVFARADKLFTRLRAARLDHTLEAEVRRLAAVDLLIIDDFALRASDPTQTNDFYELVVERHRKKSTIWVSNREPSEWLAVTTDTLLAQSAIDRLTSGAHTLIIEGPSHRQRQRVSLDETSGAQHAH